MNTNGIVIFRPNWSDLESLFRGAREIFICSPWISKEGVSFLRGIFERNKLVSEIEIWTRLDPWDYIMGNSDYNGLLALINNQNKNVRFLIKTASNLHLKVFKVNQSSILIASANLTRGGFKDNLELAILITNEELIITVNTYLKSLMKDLYEISIEDLKDFVEALRMIENLHERFENLKSNFKEALKELKSYPLKTTKKPSRPPYIGLR